jgi:hypothetical protein
MVAFCDEGIQAPVLDAPIPQEGLDMTRDYFTSPL